MIKATIILSLVFLCGCNGAIVNHTMVVQGRVPVIPTVERPKQELLTYGELAEYKKLPEEVRIKLENNDKIVKLWASQMDVSIKIYNEFARKQNAGSDEWLNSTLGKKEKK